ncbi:hypothetical protein BDY21DRAFT_68796 [Lineolata rhizophorae]|uniref:Uncharacterized protein n=1 Tax=Lineolata rhizophorae TaxID=578093 RepID=A0A6A6NV64_9PEZI|nr:hypothetical protein BDY21DRAFT_68796 [Lineolata rhizophorae]
MTEFQSTMSYLEDPPSSYAEPAVDILSGLNEIKQKISDGEYTNEFTFEAEVAQLLTSAHDGHFGFEGMAYAGVFRWRRDEEAALVSLSLDGSVPKVYAWADIGEVQEPSPVVQINGQDVIAFLQEESEAVSLHDPDARWNDMFVSATADTFGAFTNSKDYPGPNTTLTFENGTTNSYINSAIVLDPGFWGNVEDGESFYLTFIAPSSLGFRERSTDQLSTYHMPKRLMKTRDNNIQKRASPLTFPEPFITHPDELVSVSGYFIDQDGIEGGVAVLAIYTFLTGEDDENVAFQDMLQDFLAEIRNRGTRRIIVDVRSNGGGKVFLGYEAFKQLFPSIEIFGASRYRATDAANLFGEQISELEFSQRTGELYTLPFNFRSYIDENLEAFSDWEDMFGPVTANGDTFTELLRYNLSDPLLTMSQLYSLGISITGYLDRADITEDYFDPDDVVVLSDGVCASTCNIFVEALTQQAGVRSFAVGGRPQLGPMQPVGGTKGTLVLPADFLVSLSGLFLSDVARTRQQFNEWASFLPFPFSIATADATVNFQDSIRPGSDTPTQFTNETANCRVFYTPEMMTDVTNLWGAVAGIAWGDGGQMDEGRCIQGSARTQQNRANPSGTDDSEAGTTSTGAAAAVVVPPMSMMPLVCALVALVSSLLGASLM